MKIAPGTDCFKKFVDKEQSKIDGLNWKLDIPTCRISYPFFSVVLTLPS